MSVNKTLFAALALTAAAAWPTGALARAPDRAHAGGASPLPPGACVTHGAVGRAYEVGVNCRVVEVDGHPRRFVVYVPGTRPVTGPRAPVVFMFHGSSGTGEQFLRISGWREQAEATGLIAVFPTGLRYRVLDSGRRSTKWNGYSLASQVDLSERPPGYPENAPMAGGPLASSTRRASPTAPASPRSWPSRPVPTYLTVGTLDDRVLAQTGPPPLTRLPLDPLALLAEPVIRSTIGAHVATLGLDAGDFGVISERRSTSFRWPATGSGRNGAVMRFAVLDGLAHKYPNGRNNPRRLRGRPRVLGLLQDAPPARRVMATGARAPTRSAGARRAAVSAA